MEKCNIGLDLSDLKGKFKAGLDWLGICNTMLDNLMCGVAIYEVDNGIKALYLNETYYEIIGYTKDQFSQGECDCVMDILSPDDRELMISKESECIKNNTPLYCEVQAKRGDGAVIWLLIKASLVDFIESENPIFLAIIQDISERKKKSLENAIYREKNMILKEVSTAILFDYDYIGDEMTFYYKDANGKEAPLVLKNYMSYSRKSEIVHPDDTEKFFSALAESFKKPAKGELIYRTTVFDRTSYRWGKTTYSGIADDSGKVIRLVGRIEDIDEQQRENQRKDYLIETDATTGLYNKLTSMTRIQDKLARQSEGVNCFAIIDIDDFKRFNDNYGHSYGDEVLLAVANVLSECFPDAVIGRFGGDEFILYLNTLDTYNNVSKLFERFMSRTRALSIRQQPCDIRCCCGVAYTGDLSVKYGTLFDFADELLYKAKNNGKNQIVSGKM